MFNYYCVIDGEHVCGSAEVDIARLRQEDESKQIPWKEWTSESFDESRIPEAIKTIRLNRQKLFRENKITELTKKFQFGKYAMARLTENENFEHARFYLACFYINDFTNYKTRSKISEELWLRNEGLPNGEGLYQLYLWFCKERGYNMEMVREDLEKHKEQASIGAVNHLKTDKAESSKKDEKRNDSHYQPYGLK